MTETQERFLRAVLTRVPPDSIVELHLFPPIRRGTMETGVAVIATVLPAILSVVEDQPEPEPVAEPVAAVVADEIEALASDVVEGTVVEDATITDDATSNDEAPVNEAPDTGAADSDAAMASADEPMVNADGSEESAVAVEGAFDVGDEIVLSDETGTPVAVDRSDASATPVPAPRLRILTASYRHTIKGVDRGKWVVDVQEEADAPLEAVEAVLRGVRHRSTEPADPELVAHDSLLALNAPARVAPAA